MIPVSSVPHTPQISPFGTTGGAEPGLTPTEMACRPTWKPPPATRLALAAKH